MHFKQLTPAMVVNCSQRQGMKYVGLIFIPNVTSPEYKFDKLKTLSLTVCVSQIVGANHESG